MEPQFSEITCIRCSNLNRAGARFCNSCGFTLAEENLFATKTCVQRNSFDASPQSAGNQDMELRSGMDEHDRFQIKKLIHRDTGGSVFEALDSNSGETVIFKEDLECDLDEDVLQRFRNNFHYLGNRLSRIEHPRMPSVRESFYRRKHYCVVLSYLESRSLEKIIEKEKGRGLKASFSLKCILAIAEVIEALHSSPTPICHLNIKPTKVLITGDGKICLLPWVMRPDKQGDLIGTWGYASPEQCRGDYDVRSDIYGLGVLLHAMLTGKDPKKEAPFHFLPLSILRPEVAGDLEAVVRKSVSLKPEDRFQSIQEFKKSLLGPASKILKSKR